ncbi:MAG: 2-hydroxyacyl-CoA dehydratase [Oscillospiraceae bacterium]|nr:2-hydroxyacyl-CoA dehydratase [Oscillospiraceae bacterium]
MILGVDVGSTTVKVVLYSDAGQLLYKQYLRHFSRVREKTAEMLTDCRPFLNGEPLRFAITGSAGYGMAKACDLPFVQEVFATRIAIEKYIPDADAVVELGGEDAKILFLTGGSEERMNGSCAGGTGAFIDQMATLLNVTADELDRLSEGCEKLYTIASRCGVFAKSDIQPLLNQGARKEDLAASIFKAVVDQTVAGLAQGRRIQGKVVFLGGPLTFLKGLRLQFKKTLGLSEDMAVFPENAEYFVAIGAAEYAKDCTPVEFDSLLTALETSVSGQTLTNRLPPLFASEEEYAAFSARHNRATLPQGDISTWSGDAYLGIDAGSTTTKLALLSEENTLLYSYYGSNKGNPVDIVRKELEQIYSLCGDRIRIRGSAVTGYGEDLIKNAFSVDLGIVETVAHYEAAKFFDPQVDFILDIGGQDMKCFKIRNHAVDGIMLNEACSSGCGSFVETFAKALGKDIAEFARLGIFAKNPVDLGSRCTVFMNSSVKQAQKEGAEVEDISAGLSISVVKNAIYKVIRAASPADLGQHVVVQGGTFFNDAVLRSFEQELGIEVRRPTIAGLMGAFGAALCAKKEGFSQSALISPEELAEFTHTAKAATCKLCTNRCNLTVNTFKNGRKYISGNRCERPTGEKAARALPNLMEYKYKALTSYPSRDGGRGKIGIPLGLNMYENLPFWQTMLTQLGFEVVLSGESNHKLYTKGQYTIPSDTVCYPAKLMHGHIEALLDQGITRIFYPCMSYNFDEGLGDNHYNCPVVAYYPELLDANVSRLKEVSFYRNYFGLHRPKDFVKHASSFFGKEFGIPAKEVARAAKAAYAAYDDFRAQIRAEGQKAIDFARREGLPIAVVAGRPYHVDPEINHGIDRLLTSLGFVVITEDCVADRMPKKSRKVLNQWTYHSRLYNAADYVVTQPDMQLVQLVSFGCGIDAITTDEVRAILEPGGKFYTQLKIDEISNLGAVRIRLRSLVAAMAAKKSEEVAE